MQPALNGDETGTESRNALCEHESLPVGIRLMSLSRTSSDFDEEDGERFGVSKEDGKRRVMVVGLDDMDEEKMKMNVDI